MPNFLRRHSAGSSKGGQFAPSSRDESRSTLDVPASLNEAIEAEAVPWSWTALTAEFGRERAAWLYRESGGDLSRAVELLDEIEVPDLPAGQVDVRPETVPPGLVGLVVSTPDALERALIAGHRSVSIVGDGEYAVSDVGDTVVHVFDNTLLSARNAKVVCHGDSKVVATGRVSVEAHDRSKVTVTGVAGSTVTADDESQVSAFGDVEVTASGWAWIGAHGYSKVAAGGDTTVDAFDDTEVDLRDRASAIVSDRSRVRSAAPGTGVSVEGSEAQVDLERCKAATIEWNI